MAQSFPIVVVLVTSIGIALSFTRYFWPLLVAGQTGQVGSFFEHADDRPLEQHPDGNRNDPPIPVRPLRPRA